MIFNIVFQYRISPYYVIFQVALQNLILLYNGSEIITTIMMLTYSLPHSLPMLGGLLGHQIEILFSLSADVTVGGSVTVLLIRKVEMGRLTGSEFDTIKCLHRTGTIVSDLRGDTSYLDYHLS